MISQHRQDSLGAGRKQALGLALSSLSSPAAVSKSGASVTIECRALDFQATTVFWYRQFPKRGLMLMATSNVGSDATYEQGYNKDKIPISQPDLTFSSLTVTRVDPADSSLYFCGVHTASHPGKMHFGPGTRLIVL
nr:T-cell receptor beta chain (BTB4) - bovine [Bos taurus]